MLLKTGSVLSQVFQLSDCLLVEKHGQEKLWKKISKFFQNCLRGRHSALIGLPSFIKKLCRICAVCPFWQRWSLEFSPHSTPFLKMRLWLILSPSSANSRKSSIWAKSLPSSNP